jgi:hypothetical protein
MLRTFLIFSLDKFQHLHVHALIMPSIRSIDVVFNSLTNGSFLAIKLELKGAVRSMPMHQTWIERIELFNAHAVPKTQLTIYIYIYLYIHVWHIPWLTKLTVAVHLAWTHTSSTILFINREPSHPTINATIHTDLSKLHVLA